MKKVVIAYFLGAATIVLLVLACMGTGTPFKSMLVKYGIESGTGIVFTERFVVVYEGMDGDDAGASYFTYAGRDGTIPAFWRGYGAGWGGGPNGITSLTTYEPSSGTATFYFHGKLLRVEEDGGYLRIQNQRLPLGPERIVAVVDKAGSCRWLLGQEADKLVQSIPSWYQDGELNARPPREPGAAGGALMGKGKGAAIGAAAGTVGGYLIGNEMDKQNMQQQQEAVIREEAKGAVVNVQNSNGSITPVRLRRVGSRWIGPNGEEYMSLPTPEQLRPIYGF